MIVVLLISLTSNFWPLAFLCQSDANVLAEQIDELEDSRFKQRFILDLSGILADEGDIPRSKLLLSKLRNRSELRDAAVGIASAEAKQGSVDDAIETLKFSCKNSEFKDYYNAELIGMMTSAGLYAQAMELAKDASLIPPIACEAVVGSTQRAVSRLKHEELFSGRWEVIKIAHGLVRRREMEKATDLLREYDPHTLDMNMAILVVSLGDRGEFSLADEILAAHLTGSYETATRYLLGTMRPYVSDFDWVARDVRRERFIVEALQQRFRVGEWIFIEHARLDRSRGFFSNAYKYCVQANKEIAQVSGEGRPQELHSASGETLRLRQALAIEVAELNKREDAIEIACQIRDRGHYDFFLQTLTFVGASSRQQVSFPENERIAELLKDQTAAISFRLGQFSQKRVVLGPWTQLEMGRSLLELKDQTEQEIAARTFLSRDVVLAALLFEPTRLNDLLTLLIERKSVNDLCWLLWFSPAEYSPETHLKNCMRLNDPVLLLLAGSRLARGSSKGNSDVIRQLVDLSSESDQELRYSALSVLCEHLKSGIKVSGLVDRDGDDLEIEALMSVAHGNTPISDKIVSDAMELQNSWLQGLVCERVAQQSRENTDSSPLLERIWHSGSPYCIIRAAAATPQEGRVGAKRIETLQLLLDTPMSEELKMRARRILSMR